MDGDELLVWLWIAAGLVAWFDGIALMLRWLA